MSFTTKAEEIVAQGYCGAIGDGSNASWVLTSDKVLRINGNGSMADYKAEYEDEGRGVPPWYSYRRRIDKIVIDGVSTIGRNAFRYLSYKELVFKGEELKIIREYAFDGNDDLKKLQLPNSITTIEHSAFGGCRYIEGTLDLPSNLTSLGQGAFGNSGLNLTLLRIPGSLETIPNEAFNYVGYWSGNTCIIIEEGVKLIEEGSICNTCCARFPSSIEFMHNDCFSHGDYENILYGANEYTHNWAFENGCKYVDMSKKYDINNANVNLMQEELLYSGHEIKPDISQVTYSLSDPQCGDVTFPLIEGQDYEIKYSNNIDVGTGKVTIIGKGAFEGSSKTLTFDIYDLIDNCDITVEYESVLYDGKAKTPNVTVKYNDKVLEKNNDYSVTYDNNINEGLATVIINGVKNYKGSTTKNFSIYKYDISKSDCSLSYSKVYYDGNPHMPEIVVNYEGKEIIKDRDYTVEFANNINPGIATVKIQGINEYTGVIEKQFEIIGLSIEKAEVMLKESIFSYDGSPKTPHVEVKLGDKLLVQDTDYTLSYENNINDGTAHAVIVGTGVYTDTIKVSFVILPYNAGMDAVYPDGTMIDGNFVYGVMDDEANEVEVFCPASKSVSKLQIPATITDENGVEYKVTSIGNKAFYKNAKLTSVVIGNNVKSIEDYAFYGCKNIKTLKLGNGIEIIGNSSFRKCTKLTTVTLPKSIDSLGKNAFYGCSKLKTITINANSVIDVKANAIKGISKKAVIKVPKKLVKKYKKEFDKKSGFKGGMKIKKK